MKVNRISPLEAYGASQTQKDALVARRVEEVHTQVRIAENSDSRLVLLNLALNPNLDEKTVKVLFSRKLPYLTTRLKNLGYTDSWF